MVKKAILKWIVKNWDNPSVQRFISSVDNSFTYENYIAINDTTLNYIFSEKNDEDIKPEYKIISLEEYARIMKKKYTSKNDYGVFTIINAFTEDIIGVDTEGEELEKKLKTTRCFYPTLYEVDEHDELKLKDLTNPELLDDQEFFDDAFCRYCDLYKELKAIEDTYIKERMNNIFGDEEKELSDYIEKKKEYDINKMPNSIAMTPSRRTKNTRSPLTNQEANQLTNNDKEL